MKLKKCEMCSEWHDHTKPYRYGQCKVMKITSIPSKKTIIFKKLNYFEMLVICAGIYLLLRNYC